MKFFKKTDIIVILLMIVIAVGATVVYQYNNSKKSAVAEIYYNSELVETVDLNTGVERTFSIPQEEHVVFHQYKEGTISFEESDCPDKVCINSGKLGIVGESAACLPNRIVIKIVQKEGRSEDSLDIIVGK